MPAQAAAPVVAVPDDMTIRALPPKPVLFHPPVEALEPEPAYDEQAYEQHFIPPVPERAPVRSQQRMPRIEDLPIPAQNQIRAAAAREDEHAGPDRKRMTLLQRLASVGLGRREDELAHLEPGMAPPPRCRRRRRSMSSRRSAAASRRRRATGRRRASSTRTAAPRARSRPATARTTSSRSRPSCAARRTEARHFCITGEPGRSAAGLFRGRRGMKSPWLDGTAARYCPVAGPEPGFAVEAGVRGTAGIEGRGREWSPVNVTRSLKPRLRAAALLVRARSAARRLRHLRQEQGGDGPGDAGRHALQPGAVLAERRRRVARRPSASSRSTSSTRTRTIRRRRS